MRPLLCALLAAVPAFAAAPPRGAEAPRPAHWSLRQPVRPAVPHFTDPSLQGWVRNPLDAFVLARLVREGLRPAPALDGQGESGRRVLIRRVTFDLTGLPPTPEEVEAFVNDRSPDAYERLIDRLLASPAYGERWGRHWMDVARYAETEGFEYDRQRPGGWRWRDYV